MDLWRRVFGRASHSSLPRMRVWDDLDPYKKIFVAQGFYELSRHGLVDFELAPYSCFKDAGAPEPIGAPYQSHKNIVLAELAFADRGVRIAYDTNDLYYKIPNAILRWADLYFKSNYQEEYVRTGKMLRGEYWDSLTFRAECLPEPLDLSQGAKIRPCSFTMHLFPDLEKNHRFLRRWAGRWLETPPEKKPHRLFYVGRWWSDPATQPDVALTEALFREIQRHGLKIHGGIVKVGAEPPEAFRGYLHREIRLDEWTAMCSEAQVGLMTRGLDGCASFKTLNFLMLGAPFIAMEMKANLWKPLAPEVHCFRIRDDAADLMEQLAKCAPLRLAEMGRRNLEHWQRYISPEATARYVLDEASKIM